MSPKVKKTAILLGAVWLVATIASLPYFAHLLREKGNLERSFSELSSALQSAMFDKAYSQVSTEFKKATPFEEFERQQRTLISRHGTLRNVKAQGYEISIRDRPEAWLASVRASLEFERQAVPFEFWFRYENERWALYGYKQVDRVHE
jgi:hypothetical protein